MKLQLTILFLCITVIATRPSCKRSPSNCQVRSGRASTLQNALRSQGLTTLLSLVETADLVGALTGHSPLTVFAPTNEALKTFIDSLPSDPDAATVKKVLLNHVVSGSLLSGVAQDGFQVKNLDGNHMTIRVNQATEENPIGITIGGARIKAVDIPVLSLTVHVLDDVINPSNLPGRR